MSPWPDRVTSKKRIRLAGFEQGSSGLGTERSTWTWQGRGCQPHPGSDVGGRTEESQVTTQGDHSAGDHVQGS